MTADDSIRTDASTVHRSDSGDIDSSDPVSAEASSSHADPIAEARTVIRGSSRAANSGTAVFAAGKAVGQHGPIDRSPASVAKVLLGQRLNHFLLKEMIGGGGMGAVFRAHDEQLDRIVAIKVIPFVGEDPDLQRRFRNESQSAAKLDHPRIAKVFDAGSHGQWHYIVFEHVEGTNIRDGVQSDGPLSIDEAVLYTVQLADALQHASDRGIVHRDIKPSNVLIASDGKIKLVDMGLARSDNFELSEDMTASGVTLGTFDYISPEQAHDPRDADLRSDIYSLGCTLYFMLTGSPPYPGGTMLQKLLSHGNAPPPDPRGLRAEVSANLVAVIKKMLAKKPSERYQNAGDLIADLHVVAARDGLVRSRSVDAVAGPSGNAMGAWLERHLPWIVAATLLFAIAGWLHLEAAVTRQDLIIPAQATSPRRMALPSPTNNVSPTTRSPDLITGANVDQDSSTPPNGRGEVRDGQESLSSAIANLAVSETGMPNDGTGEPAIPIVKTPQITDFPEIPELVTPMPPFSVPPSVAIDPLDSAASMSDRRGNVRQGDRTDNSNPAVPSSDASIPTVVRVVGPTATLANSDSVIDRDSSGAALAPSLQRAIELAKRYELTRIEIAVAVLVTEPVRVDIDDLRITSSVPGGTVVVFQSPERVSMQPAKMFSVGSHPIEFNDLHFLWNVQSDEIDGGTLFEVNDNRSIELTDCSITINNPALRDEVYAFDVVTDPDKLSRQRRREIAVQEVFPLVDMKLYNVVIRGQISMMHMDYAAKLWLDWDNGMVAVTGRMIDTAGARTEPPPGSGAIKLSLMRVTAHLPQGILRTRLGVSGSFAVPISRVARKSLFIIDPSSPHFEILGLTPDQLSDPWLRLEGSSNAYIVDPALGDLMLQLTATDGQAETTSMSELSTTPPSWADEYQPRWSVKWVTTRLTDKPMSQRSPADYRQEDTASPPGFDEKSLPTLPKITNFSSRPIREILPMTPLGTVEIPNNDLTFQP